MDGPARRPIADWVLRPDLAPERGRYPPAHGTQENTQWYDLYHEVVDTGLCTGCTACIVACPFHVLGYEDYKPVQLQEDGPDDCAHGEKGCTLCTLRLPPLPRLGGRDRRATCSARHATPEEVDRASTRTSCSPARPPEALAQGQDGGVVSALLIWGLETRRDRRRRAPRSSPTSGSGTPSPRSSPTRRACSRRRAPATRTRANPLALLKAAEMGLSNARARRHGLPGVSAPGRWGAAG